MSHEIPSETEGQRRFEIKGLLRPAFEMIYDPAFEMIRPADANAMCLLAKKKVHFGARSVVAL